jgi:2-polyprenyl-6-methoxyphenol hydroxylase-like FAD-dependent oxidoreductase
VIMRSGAAKTSENLAETTIITNEKNEPMMERTIIVVGGGLCGLAASLGLAQLGYHVHVMERRRSETMQKRRVGTYLMQPNAIRALEELCQEAMDPLYDMGITTPSSECKMYAWWMVRDSLLRQAEKMEKITLWTGWSFTDLDDGMDSDSVKARFARSNDKDTNTEDQPKQRLELRGALLLGCDGIHSAVRTHLGLPPATPTGSMCWRGTISVDQENSSSLLASRLMDPPVYINSGPCVLGLKSYHSKYDGVMTWSISLQDDDAAIGKYRHPRDAVRRFLKDNTETGELFNKVRTTASKS